MSDYNLQQEVSDKYSLRGRVFHKIREDIFKRKVQTERRTQRGDDRCRAWCIENTCQRSIQAA